MRTSFSRSELGRRSTSCCRTDGARHGGTRGTGNVHSGMTWTSWWRVDLKWNFTANTHVYTSVTTLIDIPVYIQKSWQMTCLSCGHGSTGFYKVNATIAIQRERSVRRTTPSYEIWWESVLILWSVHVECSPRRHPRWNLHRHFQEETENFLLFSGVWLHMISFYSIPPVTIVMHLRSFSSGGTTKIFLTCNLVSTSNTDGHQSTVFHAFSPVSQFYIISPLHCNTINIPTVLISSITFNKSINQSINQ